MVPSSGDRIAPVTYLFGAAGADGRSAPEKAPPFGSQLPPSDAAVSFTAGSDPAGGDAARSGKASRRAANVSLNGLSRRNMSRWEIEKLLISRELDEETIATEVARLESVGLIDDAALAETLVRTRRERKGLGHQALVAELRRRHIDQAIIDDALAVEDEGDGEQQRANEVAIKRAGQLRSYDQETAKRRLTAFLMRKGYSSSVVRAATSAALEGSGGGGVRFR